MNRVSRRKFLYGADPRPIFKKVMDRFPEKGKQLVDVWRTKQFGYQWLRVAGGKYKNF